MPDPDHAPRGFANPRFKAAVYIACWVIALIATDPSAKYLPLVYMFPLGLFAFLVPNNTASDAWLIIFGVLAFYVVQAVVYFRSRTRARTVIMLAVLAIALICNVSGCRRMIDTH